MAKKDDTPATPDPVGEDSREAPPAPSKRYGLSHRGPARIQEYTQKDHSLGLAVLVVSIRLPLTKAEAKKIPVHGQAIVEHMAGTAGIDAEEKGSVSGNMKLDWSRARYHWSANGEDALSFEGEVKGSPKFVVDHGSAYVDFKVSTSVGLEQLAALGCLVDEDGVHLRVEPDQQSLLNAA